MQIKSFIVTFSKYYEIYFRNVLYFIINCFSVLSKRNLRNYALQHIFYTIDNSIKSINFAHSKSTHHEELSPHLDRNGCPHNGRL